MRQCHATLLDAAGAPLGTVQALLGHASPEVTRQIYLPAIPAEQRRAVKEAEKPLVGPKFLGSTPRVRQFIFRTIRVVTRYQGDLESLARRSKIELTQTRATSHPVATSNR